MRCIAIWLPTYSAPEITKLLTRVLDHDPEMKEEELSVVSHRLAAEGKLTAAREVLKQMKSTLLKYLTLQTANCLSGFKKNTVLSLD